MGRRNLLIVRAGDESVHPGWLAGAERRRFDLLVSYYGAEDGRYRSGADHYHAMPGPRWPAHHAIARDCAALLARYDYVAFACDDLAAGRAVWNKLFDACRRHALDLAQPAIDGPVSHGITAPVPGCALRHTNFVEIMCPVMSRRALAALAPTFGESRSGWGLDLLWQNLLAPTPERAWRVAIVDSVRVRHTRAMRQGTLYPTLERLGIRPEAELASIQERYALPPFAPRELSRLPLRRPLLARLRTALRGRAPP